MLRSMLRYFVLLTLARLFHLQAIRVRRVYDESSNTMVYASYSTRFNSKDSNKSRYKSSICAVHIN